MRLAKRNHYNPCFWTALWSPAYYEAFRAGATGGLEPRRQLVYALSVKADKLFEAPVENVHYDKNLGVAEITREASVRFYDRFFPDQNEEFRRKLMGAEYPVCIDFEQVLTQLEKMDHYRALLAVARRNGIAEPMEKIELACFVFLHWLRSHSILQSMLEWDRELGIERFESFVVLKWLLGNEKYLLSKIGPLAFGRTALYALGRDTFPLSDSPVLARPRSIMVALSPRLLLEIDREFMTKEDRWIVRRRIKPGKLREYRERLIGNTFREIIFSDRSTLEYWQSTPEFRHRVALMKEARSYNRLVSQSESRELWAVNAYGNQ